MNDNSNSSTTLPSEYAGSVYTKKLKGTAAKAKANAAQAIPEMIEIASNGIKEGNNNGYKNTGMEN